MQNPWRRLLRSLPLAAVGLALGLAQPVAAAESAEAEADARLERDRPFLWRIDGGAQPSYLFGTIHAGVRASELHPVVDSALHRSRLFVMETLPEGGLVGNQNASRPAPMDLALAQHARELGKPVALLETVAFQRSLLKELVREGLGGPEEFSAMLADDPQAIALLVAAYRSGNVEEIAELSRPEDARMQEILLDARNRRWAHALGPALGKGGVFAAVGVGHAPGPMGLLALFAERGYRVQQYSQVQS